MTKMIHYCDTERCINCSGCVIACKEGNHVPVGVSRRWIVTQDEGTMKEKSESLACRHCDEPECLEACPEEIITKRADGVVQIDKDNCTSCESCVDACPYGIPKFLRDKKKKPISPVQKCTFCAGGPKTENFSEKEMKLYGQNRIAEGKPVLCAAFCATKALVSGDKENVDAVIAQRKAARASR